MHTLGKKDPDIKINGKQQIGQIFATYKKITIYLKVMLHDNYIQSFKNLIFCLFLWLYNLNIYLITSCINPQED